MRACSADLGEVLQRLGKSTMVKDDDVLSLGAFAGSGPVAAAAGSKRSEKLTTGPAKSPFASLSRASDIDVWIVSKRLFSSVCL